MIRGKQYLKIIKEKNYKPFIYSIENLKMLFETFNKVTVTEYYYDNGINRQVVWIDEWYEHGWGFSLEWIKKLAVEELTSKVVKKRIHEKRFFYTYRKNAFELFFYLRDVSFEKKDIYFVFYNEGEDMPPIYIVTAFERMKGFKAIGARRPMGFFYSKDDAERFVKSDDFDISARSMFKYVKIEERNQGVPSICKSVDMYELKGENFVLIKKSNNTNDSIFVSI